MINQSKLFISIHEVEGSGSSSDSDAGKQMRNELRKNEAEADLPTDTK